MDNLCAYGKSSSEHGGLKGYLSFPLVIIGLANSDHSFIANRIKLGLRNEPIKIQ